MDKKRKFIISVAEVFEDNSKKDLMSYIAPEGDFIGMSCRIGSGAFEEISITANLNAGDKSEKEKFLEKCRKLAEDMRENECYEDN